MVVVGGGFGGLGAAYTFFREAEKSQSCLVLDNHSIFGGEAKQNEFEVDGCPSDGAARLQRHGLATEDRREIRSVSSLLE